MLSLSLLFFSFSPQTETTQFHPSLTLCVCVSVSVCCSVYDLQSFKTMTNCQTQRGEGTKKNDFLHISEFLFLCEILSRDTFESCSCSWAGGRRTPPALRQKVNKSIINSAHYPLKQLPNSCRAKHIKTAVCVAPV